MTTIPAFKETEIDCANGIITLRQMEHYSYQTISIPFELWGHVYELITNEVESYLLKVEEERTALMVAVVSEDKE